MLDDIGNFWAQSANIELLRETYQILVKIYNPDK